MSSILDVLISPKLINIVLKLFIGDFDDLLCPLHETPLVLNRGNKIEGKTNEDENNSETDAIDGINNNNLQNQPEDDEVIETLKSSHQF